MTLLNYLIPFALALGLLILVHEMGHYLVARWCGVKVLRFFDRLWQVAVRPARRA